MKTYGLFDLAAVVPSLFSLYQNEWLYYLKITRYVRTWKLLQTVTDGFRRFMPKILIAALNIERTVSLAFFFVVFSLFFHFVTCIWIWLDVRNTAEEGWLKSEGISDQIVSWQAYTSSFYYIIVTFTKTGYGDIVSANLFETMGSLFLNLLSMGAFALLAAKFQSIQRYNNKQDKKGKIKQEKLDKLFMILHRNGKRKIPFGLALSIRRYYNEFIKRNLGTVLH